MSEPTAAPTGASAGPDRSATPAPPSPNGSGHSVESDLATAYRELQNLLLERRDVTDFLQEVAVLAAFVMPGCSCGITMRRDHEVVTVAASDDFAAAIDEIQYGRGQGPCLESLHTGTVVSVPDLAADDR